MQPLRAYYVHSLYRASNVGRAVSQAYHRHLSHRATRPHPEQLATSNLQGAVSCSFAASMSTARSATSQFKPVFAAGSDESTLSLKLNSLLAPAYEGKGHWALIPSGEGLERSFKFKTFAKTWVSDFLLHNASLLHIHYTCRSGLELYYTGNTQITSAPD